MGYEGHIVGLEDRAARTDDARGLHGPAHAGGREQVGGEVISAGGTGTYDLNTWATEIQAGSYALMDTAYAKLGLPFIQALSVLSTVISVSDGLGRGRLRAQGARAWTTATRRSKAATCGSARTST